MVERWRELRRRTGEEGAGAGCVDGGDGGAANGEGGEGGEGGTVFFCSP